MSYTRRSLAVKTAVLRSKSTVPTSDVGHCLREVRECYAIPKKEPTAFEAWRNAMRKHPVTGDLDSFLKSIPRGVPVFWQGGHIIVINGRKVRPGHVAIATGFGRNGLSTDILRAGYFDKVRLELIHAKWGLQLLGWTEDLNGVKVYP